MHVVQTYAALLPYQNIIAYDDMREREREREMFQVIRAWHLTLCILHAWQMPRFAFVVLISGASAVLEGIMIVLRLRSARPSASSSTGAA